MLNRRTFIQYVGSIFGAVAGTTAGLITASPRSAKAASRSEAYVERVRFLPCVRHSNTGRVFLGYLSVALIAPSVLPGGSDMRIVINDMQLSTNPQGVPVIEFKSERIMKGGIAHYYPHAYAQSAETKAWITSTIFALPEVQRVLQEV